jgi:signal transduction histidine kinase
MAEAAARPVLRADWGWLDGIPAAGFLRRPLHRIGRDLRFTLLLCAVLIAASLAAYGILEIRQDRGHDAARSAAFEQRRAQDIAAAVASQLDRYGRIGHLFAESPQLYRSADLGRAEPAIRDMAVWDAKGGLTARLQAAAAPDLPEPAFAGPRIVYAGGLALREGGRVIEVLFDAKSLAFPGAALVPSGAEHQAMVPGWPVAIAVAAPDKPGWITTLPLYLILALGPAVTAAFLAVLLVGAFERQARAARAIRALKSVRPVEARLMVRLAEAERGAREALRAKSEFMAHMSHELRTPLNAVIGFSDIIADGIYGDTGHPKYTEYARDIAQAGRALHARIGDILEFANIEAGHYPLKEEAVELAELAQACVEDHQGRAFSRRISLSLAFGEPGKVRADSRAVRRILSNLLVNALAYTAEGGIVRADIRFEDGAGVVTLSDSGAGFSEAERSHAGRPFTRFDRAGTVTGAGLGLAIAMELARRMGGAMRLAGQDGGGGATMELRLPQL